MGHAHYWNMSDRPNGVDWEAFSTDLKMALQWLGIGLADHSGKPDTDPVFTDKQVGFNGIEDESAEAFILDRNPTDFDFCKTYQRSYDKAVMVALIIADHHFGMYDFEATSDGNPVEWEDALRFVRNRFDYGDFPFDEDNLRTGFIEGYAERYIEDYRRIRADLGISENSHA